MSNAIPNPSEELQDIHQKREALLKIVKITHAVERLLKGMQAVLLLGQPSSAIPSQALKAYQNLSKRTTMLSSQNLKKRLQRLDQLVLGMMEGILEIAGVDHDLLEQYITDPHDEVKTSDNQMGNTINDFRRSSQTSVALRILLRERGESSPALKFNIPENVIKQQIQALEERESRCRREIEKNIQEIQEATGRIILNEDASDEMRAIVEKIQRDLDRDLMHIKSGKSIDDMPMLIEVVELQDNENIEDATLVNVDNTSSETKDNFTEKSVNRGLVRRFFYWLSTPLNVKWKDTR